MPQNWISDCFPSCLTMVWRTSLDIGSQEFSGTFSQLWWWFRSCSWYNSSVLLHQLMGKPSLVFAKSFGIMCDLNRRWRWKVSWRYFQCFWKTGLFGYIPRWCLCSNIRHDFLIQRAFKNSQVVMMVPWWVFYLVLRCHHKELLVFWDLVIPIDLHFSVILQFFIRSLFVLQIKHLQDQTW